MSWEKKIRDSDAGELNKEAVERLVSGEVVCPGLARLPKLPEGEG